MPYIPPDYNYLDINNYTLSVTLVCKRRKALIKIRQSLLHSLKKYPNKDIMISSQLRAIELAAAALCDIEKRLREKKQGMHG